MRLLPLLPILVLSVGACGVVRQTPAWAPGAAVYEPGTLAGSWREIRRDGRRVNQGYALSISSFAEPTFAVQAGCVATGGVLHRLGNNAFRLERYETGFSMEGCGPWRTDPKVAPFDGREVKLVRIGQSLIAEGAGHRVEFRRLPVPVV